MSGTGNLAAERSCTAPTARTVAAALAALVAAWSFAGSLGLLAAPLRNALAATALLVLLVAAGPQRRRASAWLRLVATLGLTLVLATAAPPAGVWGVALVLTVLAHEAVEGEQRLLLRTAQAVTVLGLYRLAVTAIPTVWTAAQGCGVALGQGGATFAGLDLLVPLLVLVVGELVDTAPSRWSRTLGAVTALLAVHGGYLFLLAATPHGLAALPAPAAAPADPYLQAYTPPDWQLSQALAALLPWNLPALAALLDLVVLTIWFRTSRWLPPLAPAPAGHRTLWATVTAGVLAIALPWLVSFAPAHGDLARRTIVAYDPGQLDWKKPVHGLYGRASAGRFGMLPTFVESLGGRLRPSAELSAEELAEADVVLLLEPEQPLPEERLQRLWRYVRGGGSLLVASGQAPAVNAVLRPTSLRLRGDVARAAVASWEDALECVPHPATTGLLGHHNRLGLMHGSSIAVAWPAQPLLVGRFGWSAANAESPWQAGQPLGDRVLAAEQSLGQGTVILLGDAWGLTNEGLPNAYLFVGRLLDYLAAHRPSPQSDLRQTLGLAVAGLLLGLLLWRGQPGRVAVVATLLGLSWATALWAGDTSRNVLPDGREPGSPIAYLDASHVEASSQAVWGFDGLDGLKLALMRNGYLPLMAPDLSAARLERAALVISMAPARAFSAAERAAIRRFVERGGTWLSLVGGPESGPSAALLAQFGFRIPRITLPALADHESTHAERRFCTPYLRAAETGSHDCFVWMDTAWPIECPADAVVVCRDFDGRPILAVRAVGQGQVVVVGDSGFAMNKNLEYVGGQPFGGGYENAHFWHWFLGELSGQPTWIPPAPPSDEPQAPDPQGPKP